ncbi:keratin, type I cytoskeletal 13-like [Chanos chanos]|uniref:Keratin, type I cytoskeletal 13-like n=1 Tax=Chanos chanos TaxID=29144 RepID=A0A6J2WZT0_CHACN|nr:keratin, type I cytoskeletal 13-like [Chanos chanos]
MSSSFSSSFSSRGGLGLSSVGGLGVARAGSVYGGAGGKGVRISSSSSSGRFGSLSVGFGSGGGGGGGGGGAGFGAFSMEAGGDFSAVTVSEKQAMQNLNDRLARYLERVRTLEEANAKLEAQIKEWGLTHNKISTPDLGAHHAAIDDLRAKILAAGAVIGNLSIQIDNAKLAAEDFKIKYESEFGLRQSVEADIAGLRKILGEISLVRSDLELQMEGLLEEMAYLKKNHTEETISFKTQLGGQVQVEVDAAPATDLNAVISEIRAQYESLVLKNQRDAEAWFNAKAETLQQEVKSRSEVLQTSSVELKSGTTTYRDLEIQLQAMLSLKASLEGSLAETEVRYSSILQNLQATVTSLEAQLAQIRGDTERQSMDYRSLLDIKARLEMEIAEYKRLLEGGVTEDQVSSSTITTTVTMVEEVVDGEVVSTSTKTEEVEVVG